VHHRSGGRGWRRRGRHGGLAALGAGVRHGGAEVTARRRGATGAALVRACVQPQWWAGGGCRRLVARIRLCRRRQRRCHAVGKLAAIIRAGPKHFQPQNYGCSKKFRDGARKASPGPAAKWAGLAILQGRAQVANGNVRSDVKHPGGMLLPSWHTSSGRLHSVARTGDRR
jgi:hypothetical protein